MCDIGIKIDGSAETPPFCFGKYTRVLRMDTGGRKDDGGRGVEMQPSDPHKSGEVCQNVI
jgi:hypothetical protein